MDMIALNITHWARRESIQNGRHSLLGLLLFLLVQKLDGMHLNADQTAKEKQNNKTKKTKTL